MKVIDATGVGFEALNNTIRESQEDIEIVSCLGQRFIGAGQSNRKIMIHGVPGNALGAYLNGAEIEVRGNAQDAVGDTMNAGSIVIRGNIGDAAGYAMRGGKILVQGNAGYRAGIHMKAYKEKCPVMVVGGRCGNFLGEYQAGGLIVVLGMHSDGKPIVGDDPCTGMHGGKMFLRSDCKEIHFPPQVNTHIAGEEEKEEIKNAVEDFCKCFGSKYKLEEILQSTFTVITPDSKNPYKQMYVAN